MIIEVLPKYTLNGFLLKFLRFNIFSILNQFKFNYELLTSFMISKITMLAYVIF